MNRRQYLLTKLAEECAEVAKEALKQSLFGKDATPPVQEEYPENIPNHKRLMNEIIDLNVVVKMLKDIGEVENVSLTEKLRMVGEKRAKIERYYRIAQNLGNVGKDVCTRCNVGNDNDGDGDCAVCARVPDEHMPLRG